MTMKRALVLSLGLCLAGPLAAATFIPIRDRELFDRSDVVVHAIVVSSDVVQAERWPETVTVLRPLRVLKGQLAGPLVIHQAGGVLPGGVAYRLPGRPIYSPGEEVVVFAIAREEGDFQTAEMLLGKFTIASDESGRLFAMPALTANRTAGIRVEKAPVSDPPLRPDFDQFPSARISPRRFPAVQEPDSLSPPRDLARFLDGLGRAPAPSAAAAPAPVGALTPVLHAEERRGLVPEWANVGDEPGGQLERWFNDATAAFYLDGTANMSGGGSAEATAALATWTNDPNSTINYTKTSDTSKFPIHLNAPSAPCGWSTCIAANTAGVVGCGGSPSDIPPDPCPADHLWRGDCYGQIGDFRSFPGGSGPEVWLRCQSTADAFSSAEAQAILTHEAGHTLGLDHPDQFTSPHDLCPGDESSAIMNSTTEGSNPSTSLGTDDQDAIRWLYGDGGNHCGAGGTPTASPTRTRTPSRTPTRTATPTPTRTPTPPVGGPVVSSIAPTSGPASGGTSVTITGSNFVTGAVIRIGGSVLTNVVLTATSITGKTPVLPPGSLNDVVVTNPSSAAGTLAKGWLSDFSDVNQGYLYHAAIEKIVRAQITTGCGSGKYCPSDPVTRDAMAKFLLVAKNGAAFSPTAATGTVFCDVTTQTLLAKWIEEMKTENITTGCDAGACGKPDYCPTGLVTRDAMSKFLLLAKNGSSFNPAAATGTVFDDVKANTFLAKWIEELFHENVTGGCGTANGKPTFCPTGVVSRGEMAKFLKVAFAL